MIFFIIFIVLILTGCGSDMKNESPQKNVKILFAGDASASPFILFEFIEPNTFDVVSFQHFTLLRALYPENLTANCKEYGCERNIFNSARVDDFITKAPRINSILNFTIPHVEYPYEIVDEGTLELSEEQLENIKNLIGNIARSRVDREFERPKNVWGRLTYVWVIIDGNIYWSLYESNIDILEQKLHRYINPYVNRDVLLLAYELIDSSPITIGWESSPLRMPEG